jgi:hypothetical protein
VIYWIYTVVVRSIVIYAATVWWHGVKFRPGRAELSKLQRLACLGITGAMRTAPTSAIEVLLKLSHCTCVWWLRSEHELIDFAAAKPQT